jgi:hypothetical protein
VYGSCTAFTQPPYPSASERYVPPSLPRYTRPGRRASQIIACWSTWMVVLSAVQVCPPSFVLISGTPATWTFCGWSGSTHTLPNHQPKEDWEARSSGVSGSRVQVSPPSVLP